MPRFWTESVPAPGIVNFLVTIVGLVPRPGFEPGSRDVSGPDGLESPA